MADRELIIRITPSRPRPIDGLCPACWLPSLVAVDLCTVSGRGVSTLGTWRGCSTEGCDYQADRA